VQRNQLVGLVHALNLAAAIASLATCPRGRIGERCAVHALVFVGIEAFRMQAWLDKGAA
jgi:hypothetical protein